MKAYWIVVIIFFSLGSSVALAESSSSNFSIDNANTQNSTGNSNSSNYVIDCQQVGDTISGESSSSAYQIIHGVVCNNTNVNVNIVCLPDNRYLVAGDNFSNKVTIEIRPVNGDINSILFSQSVITDVHGSYDNLQLVGISSGYYDITCKGWNTLRQKESNVYLFAGATVDFSHGGIKKALAGDIDVGNEGNRSSSMEEGDNEINASDYSVLVTHYGLTGASEERFDLDAYGGNATASDYSIVVFNYNNVGE